MTNSNKTAAEQIVRAMKERFPVKRIYRLVDENEFPQIVAAYRRMRAKMEALDFIYLADIELPHLSDNAVSIEARTMYRSFVHADGSILSDYSRHGPRLGRMFKTLFSFQWILSASIFFKAFLTTDAINFETEFDDGSFVVTNNNPSPTVFSRPPDIDSESLPRNTAVERILSRHRERIAERLVKQPGIQAVKVVSVEELLALQDRLQAKVAAYRASINWVTLEEITTILHKHSALAFPIFSEIQRLENVAPPADGEPDHATHERNAFLQQLEPKPKQDKSSRSKFTVTCLTALGFVAVAGIMSSLDFALILLLVVAIHEGGHFLAMLVFGYRNLNVFFVPGLGAVTSGTKDRVPAWQAVLIYLAGPLPGIVLGIGALLLQSRIGADSMLQEPLRTFTWITLIINYFNLLPIVPLDGGKLVERLLFTRLPWARFAFGLLSLIVLGAVAWALRSYLLALVCLLIGLALPLQGRVAGLLSNYKKRFGAIAVDRAEAAERLYALRGSADGEVGKNADYLAVARAALPSIQLPPPRWRDTAAGLALYGFLLFAIPVAGFMAWFNPAKSAVESSVSAPEDKDGGAARYRADASRALAAKVAAATSDEQRWDIYMSSANEFEETDSAAIESAWTIASQWPQGDPRRIKTIIARSQNFADAIGAKPDQNSAERSRALRQQARDEITHATTLDGDARAGLLYSLSSTADADDAHAESDLEAAFAALPMERESVTSYEVRYALARLRYAQSRYEDAERLLLRNYQATGLPSGAGANSQLAADITALLVERGQPQRAYEFATRAALALPADSFTLGLARADAAAVGRDWPTALKILDQLERNTAHRDAGLPWLARLLRWGQARYSGGRTQPFPLLVQRLDVYIRSKDDRADDLARDLKADFQARMFLKHRYCRPDEHVPAQKTWDMDRNVRIGRSLRSAGLCSAV